MIEAVKLGVIRGGVTLLEPFDLRVARSEMVAVRGANGSGKTTLLNAVAGKLVPTTGSVRVAGESVNLRSAHFRRRVAGVIGLPPFARDLTLREHATFIAATWGLSVDAARIEADRVLDELTLGRLADRFAHELSSGQTQLAALALVLVRPFDLLVVDEPEQRLDEDHLETVITVLRGVRARGCTVLCATHSERIATEAADRQVELTTA